MPNGYYIHDESEEILYVTMDDETEFTFSDVGNLFVSEDEDKKYTIKDIEEFRIILYGGDNFPRITPFWTNVKGERVISIVVKFVS